jgi:hypothetical protein
MGVFIYQELENWRLRILDLIRIGNCNCMQVVEVASKLCTLQSHVSRVSHGLSINFKLSTDFKLSTINYNMIRIGECNCMQVVEVALCVN